MSGYLTVKQKLLKRFGPINQAKLLKEMSNKAGIQQMGCGMIGTVIKITNPMTNRTTFAKVVGRFTDNESTKDVILVMTKNVADSLGALDKRFHVNISYGSPNE